MPESEDGSSSVTERDDLVDGPLVFISHDSRDAVIAEAFCTLLSNVSAGMLQTFCSSDKKGSQGFEYGAEWYPELMKRLDAACDVVCLLTKQSLNRPWLLYEAGVAKGKLDVPVHGLALGVPLNRAIAGPFAQFANCDDDVDSISKLVVQLVKRLKRASPNEALVRQQVEVFGATIKSALEAGPEDDHVVGPFDDSYTTKMFEEIKVMFQDMPSRIEGSLQSPASSRRRRPVHPMMIEETVMMLSRGEPEVGMACLIIGSFVREDIPWLYEMGVSAYEASLASNRAVERKAVSNFTRAAEMALHGPMSYDLMNRKDLNFFQDLPMLIDRMVMRHSDIHGPEKSTEADPGPD